MPFLSGLGLTSAAHSDISAAFTHPSYSSENNCANNYERLEFLGDAVLSIVLAEAIFQKWPTAPEGFLSRMRARYIEQAALYRFGQQLGLTRWLRVGGAIANMPAKPSIVADCFEALLGAIYRHSGLEGCRQFLSPVLQNLAAEPTNWRHNQEQLSDAKSRLQEKVQKKLKIVPEYRLISVNGPDHHPEFLVEVLVRGKPLARGSGSSQKAAEQQAAAACLAAAAF